MIGTDVMNMDDMDAIVNAFNNDDLEKFMEVSGQGGNSNRQVGLPVSILTTMQKLKMVRPCLVVHGRCILMVGLSMLNKLT